MRFRSNRAEVVRIVTHSSSNAVAAVNSSPQFRYFLSQEAREKGVKLTVPRALDAGFDIAALSDTTILPSSKALISTGLHVQIPEHWVGLIRDRSSVASRGGVTAAGVIDAAYRGEVKVLMYNLGPEPLVLKQGERIAQMLILPHLSAPVCEQVESLDQLDGTERGSGGFGSTGR